jgi:hypothetical protein
VIVLTNFIILSLLGIIKYRKVLKWVPERLSAGIEPNSAQRLADTQNNTKKMLH